MAISEVWEGTIASAGMEDMESEAKDTAECTGTVLIGSMECLAMLKAGTHLYCIFCEGIVFDLSILDFRFIQMAEENSRPAFQSIESVVGAVGSIAMMLENTFFAMTSSFRAILGNGIYFFYLHFDCLEIFLL